MSESVFSSKSFIVYGLMFRSLNNFEFIFVYGEKTISLTSGAGKTGQPLVKE